MLKSMFFAAILLMSLLILIFSYESVFDLCLEFFLHYELTILEKKKQIRRGPLHRCSPSHPRLRLSELFIATFALASPLVSLVCISWHLVLESHTVPGTRQVLGKCCSN